MLTFLRRLWRDDRVEEANARLEQQYDELDGAGDQLGELMEKLDKAVLGSPECRKKTDELRRSVSGRPAMRSEVDAEQR